MKPIQRCDSCGKWTTREQAAVWDVDLVFCTSCYGVSKDFMRLETPRVCRHEWVTGRGIIACEHCGQIHPATPAA